ncbi:MAG: putative cytochrome c-type biosis protein [Rickettsiaceae bacterium]|jgi:cytochrome c-type biogenesis protein CcmH|nr:putative cytochrome c-type biosis protein [Rickettsiaceae bacterium]
MKALYKLIFFIFMMLPGYCFAIAPEQHLPEAQEERARALFYQIKCPVCAGQVIESSDTEAAYQLRKLIREKIAAGETDEEIKADLVKEYGEDILTSPGIDGSNISLWIMPLMFVLAGMWFIRKMTSSS